MLDWGETRNHRDHHIAESLRQLIGGTHRFGEQIGRLDDIFNYGNALSAVAVEQFLVAMTLEKEIELPDQIPNVVQAGIHPLPAKWTVNVRRVARNKNTALTQASHLAVMDVKIAAPVESPSFDSAGGALSQHLADKIQRRGVAFLVFDGGNHPAARGAHGKNCHGSEFAGTQFHLVAGQGVIG